MSKKPINKKLPDEIEITNRPDYTSEKKVNIDFMEKIERPKKKFGFMKIAMVVGVLYLANTARTAGVSGVVEQVQSEIKGAVETVLAPIQKAKDVSDQFEQKNEETIKTLDEIVDGIDSL